MGVLIRRYEPRYKRKKGGGREASPFFKSMAARCRPPVSGALASHGLTPQYSRRDGA